MVLDELWRTHTEKFGHAGVRPVHIVAFTLALINFSLNGMIWFAFHACTIIINKSHLHLFYALAVTNCLTGFFSILTFLNLFAYNNINCPKWSIIIGSAFEIGLDRGRAIFVLAIALERLFAIYRPRAFYLSDNRKIRTHCVATSSSGPIFHAYFLVMSISDGVALLAVYAVFLIKIFSFRKTLIKPSVTSSVKANKYSSSQKIKNQKRIKNQLGQANALTIYIICFVLIFSVLPSMMYSYDMVMGKVIFMDLGPVITIGYHLHGITSSFCYNYKHREIRKIIRKVFLNQNNPCLMPLREGYVSTVRVDVTGKYN
ncbi:hypothetical protein PRIPAC_80758 [Pristionchus pacificus]|uniref:Uncharacterized protein n=1 Tax=Pristionchus pacificus TaxID=54126 RepID=A0A2A6CQ53_PRIPA|nr:hypothetical protein PRIPAC_80758 [Pristionchus pacificus]|eukprot:PDM80218.1 hypothetical protein PRIPAC_32797 [Pristionchus pacificus]